MKLHVSAGEVAAVLWAFAYFFCLLCGYYVLRPVRDEMAFTRDPSRPSRVISVTGSSGCGVHRTTSGMPFSRHGAMHRGCSTLAPIDAISWASS